MIQRIDRHAELRFASLCTAAGAACNKSEDDRHGWDHIVEIPPAPHPDRPPDRQPRLVTVLAQVKSTQADVPKARIKLSNALKAVQSDLPCFIIMFSYSGNSSTVHARHVWRELMERTLKRARLSEMQGLDSLNKQKLSVSFGERDRIEDDDIVAWISDTVSSIGEDYATKKAQMRETCGYGKRRYIGTFTLGPLRDAEQVVDHEIGNIDSLPVTEFVLHEERFGMRSLHPEIASQGGRIKIKREAEGQAILVVSNQRGERFELPAKVRAPSLVPFEHEAFKVRMQAGVLDFAFSPGRSRAQAFRFGYDESAKYSLYEQVRFLDFVQWCKEGDVDLRLMSDVGILLGAKVQVSHQVIHWEISNLRSFLELLINIGGDTQSRNILAAGIDLENSMKASFPVAMLVKAENARVGIRAIFPNPEVDLLSGFVVIELENWCFTSILEFKIVNVFQGTEDTALDVRFCRFVMNTAILADFDAARSAARAAFDQYMA
ncbi:MAG: hypothetical protein F4103_01695, partial [Boseongicola sp. SB0673_bin_14]|nr:hypothetical protein [Boseongicola sp. SB0673_bin_14]